MEIIHIDHNNEVVCDFCNKNWTDSTQQGGILFQSKAVCPDCTPKMMKDIVKYEEEYLIKGTCPDNMSFSNWIKGMR